uniref:(northern house mosquito) hypothetical protein n=1 Tax=Culex pipiens TaxID=7175 RepID=A0A8D8MPF6_CULPI
MSTEPVVELPLEERTAVRRRLGPTSGYRISNNRRTTNSSNNHNHTTSRKRVAVAREVPPCWVTEASRPTTRTQLLCHIINITSHSSSSSITAAITSSRRRCRIITTNRNSNKVTKLRRTSACARTVMPITTSNSNNKRTMETVATAACRTTAAGTRTCPVVRGHRTSRGVTRDEEKTTWTAAVALCTLTQASERAT